MLLHSWNRDQLLERSLKAEQLTMTRLASAMSKVPRHQAGCCASSFLQLLKQNLFCFTARLDVMLQVWDNGRDQREDGCFPSLQYKEHPLCTISLVHYGWNSKRAWPQHVGLLQSHILKATYPLADGYMPCIVEVWKTAGCVISVTFSR